MKRICDICGCEADEYWMMHYNTGTGLKWLCWDCYKNSQYEVAKSEIHRRTKLARTKEERRRNK